MYAVLGLAKIKSKQITCKSAKAYYIDLFKFCSNISHNSACEKASSDGKAKAKACQSEGEKR